MDPTEAGFLAFIRNVMRIPTGALPDNEYIIGYAYNYAIMIVNQVLQIVGSPNPAYPTYYAIAVYNLAGDTLVNYAPDQPGSTYFADLRAALKLDSFVAGVVSSSSDNATSQSLELPDFFKNLTLDELQLLKTPWGRRYLGLAQAYGPAGWGIT